MNKKFDLNWESLCDDLCNDMLIKLTNSDEIYAELMSEYTDLNNEVCRLIKNGGNLTEENIEDMKKLITLHDDMKDIERKALYSRGFCDGIMLSEKFA